jgi:predicted glutamine amidotransferase
MGYISSSEQTLEEITGDSFEQFAALSSKHCDGWGIASVDSHLSSIELAVEPTQADHSAAFKRITSEQKSDGALLHLRWATSGLTVKEGNTHPFTYENYSFIHNGGVVPAESLDPFVDPSLLALSRGETDSEKYFYLIITEIKRHGEIKGIQSALKIITSQLKYSSLNAMILTPTTFYIISEYKQERRPQGEAEDYYELFYRKDDHGVLVASSGWNQTGWTPILNHQILVIDRTSFAIELYPTV